jgi:pimeloyl-ACP methyl ester carboxylesterase
LEVPAVLVSRRQNDEAIPPDAERQFASRMGATTVEIASGHVAMVSHPDAAADLIRQAAAASVAI